MHPLEIFKRLLEHYGPQGWWPAEDPLEVAIGAVLTQNTNWANAERALMNLKERGLVGLRAIASANPEELGGVIRPSGYYRQKAERLIALSRRLLSVGGLDALAEMGPSEARDILLSIKGIGYETADSILLYALGIPFFVVDAYTWRLFDRLGSPLPRDYERARILIESQLPRDPLLFMEFHALIVRHGKETCRAKPRCDSCPLRNFCPSAIFLR